MNNIKRKITFADKGKVLFMVDQEAIRTPIGQMLIYLGYEVEFASDGIEVIEIYKKAKESGQSFDVVILDLIIPGGIGGEKAIKKILEIDPNAKAIITSGYSNDPILIDYQQYGFSDSISKPYTINELSEKLDQLIMSIEYSVL